MGRDPDAFRWAGLGFYPPGRVNRRSGERKRHQEDIPDAPPSSSQASGHGRGARPIMVRTLTGQAQALVVTTKVIIGALPFEIPAQRRLITGQRPSPARKGRNMLAQGQIRPLDIRRHDAAGEA